MIAECVRMGDRDTRARSTEGGTRQRLDISNTQQAGRALDRVTAAP